MQRIAGTSILVIGLAGCGGTSIEAPPDRGLVTAAQLQSFDSCKALTTTLRTNLKVEMRAVARQWKQPSSRFEGRLGGDLAPPAAAAPAPVEGVDYSGTNNQESGVDEADWVKTDGANIYVINGNRLEILGVPRAGELNHRSTLEIEGAPGQMLLDADRVVVFSSIYTPNLPLDHPLRALTHTANDTSKYYYARSLVKVTVIDVSDDGAPVVTRELYVDGTFEDAREIDGTVRLVNYSRIDVPRLVYWPDLAQTYWHATTDERVTLWDAAVAAATAHNDTVIDDLSIDELTPQIYEHLGSGEVTSRPFTQSDCDRFVMARDGKSRAFTSIVSIDLGSDRLAFTSSHIVSNPSQVYASAGTLLIAEAARGPWWYWENQDAEEATNIHRFDIHGTIARYTGSGRVKGTVLNAFSLSEHNGSVRVASTTNNWNRALLNQPVVPENHVTVLAGTTTLSVLGEINGIAKGERIWSARFVGDKGYLVTFRNIDPLWTVDLSDPTKPAILGELEVPGVSTYIHPLDPQHLLTIGFGGTATGLNWRAQLALFDVTDQAAPILDARLDLTPAPGDHWQVAASSEAVYEHKAFQYWAPRQLLAVPLSTWRYNTQDGSYEYVSKLQLVHVDVVGGIELYGAVDHSDFYNNNPREWWSRREIRRSIFMGDYIYAISDRAVTAHRLDQLDVLSASVALPGTPLRGYSVDDLARPTQGR